jgi:Fe-S-cluster containining protein
MPDEPDDDVFVTPTDPNALRKADAPKAPEEPADEPSNDDAAPTPGRGIPADAVSMRDVISELNIPESSIARAVSSGEVRAYRDENTTKISREDIARIRTDESDEAGDSREVEVAFAGTFDDDDDRDDRDDTAPVPAAADTASHAGSEINDDDDEGNDGDDDSDRFDAIESRADATEARTANEQAEQPTAIAAPVEAPADVSFEKSRCFPCGALCCSYMAIEIDSPSTPEEYDNVRWYLCHEKTSIFVDGDAWFVNVENRCRFLLPDGACGIYETRPQVCRNYDDTTCEYVEPNFAYTMTFNTVEEWDKWVIERQDNRNRGRQRRGRRFRSRSR